MRSTESRLPGLGLSCDPGQSLLLAPLGFVLPWPGGSTYSCFWGGGGGSSMKSLNSLALILSTSFLGRAARPGPACTSVCWEGCLIPWSALCAVFPQLAPLTSVIALHLQGSDKPSALVTLITVAFCLACLALACILAVTLACSYYSCPCTRGSGPDHPPYNLSLFALLCFLLTGPLPCLLLLRVPPPCH